MPIPLQCPNPACAKVSSAPDELSGRPVRCKNCGQTFVARPTRDGGLSGTGQGPPPGQPGHSFPSLPADFGRYRVLRLLGRGGMGTVYLAEDSTLGRKVALKLPSFGPGERADRAERFVREARSAAVLQHPNVCTVFDAGQIDGRPFLTMAYIEGQPLDAVIDPDTPMPQGRAARIAQKVALALDHAHSKGIIHRDLKPANVMLNAAGEPVVMDFGLARRLADADTNEARLTRDGAVLGTPSYMAPEQVRGELDRIGPATDVYALGVMLFEMLTGHPPYIGPFGAVMGQVLTAPVPPVSEFRPDIDPRLEAACRRAMAKAPADRFPSMAAFATALGEALPKPADAGQLRTTRTPPLRPPSPDLTTRPPQPRKAPARGPWKWPLLIGAAAIALLALGAFALLAVRMRPGEVVLELSDPSAQVELQVDGKPVGLAGPGRALTLPAGDHQLSVSGPGLESFTQPFTVTPGQRLAVRVALKPRTAPAPADDLRRLQGRWHTVAEEYNGVAASQAEIQSMRKSVEVTEDLFVIDRAGRDGARVVFRGKARLDPTRSPKWFDWSGTLPDGTPGEMRGLYELTADTFRLVYATGGKGATITRPSRFDTTHPGGGVVVLTLMRSPPAETSPAKFVPLFNGKDLTGWVVAAGDPGDWQVKDGELVGLRVGTRHGWLLTDKDYGRYVLRFEFRMRQMANTSSGVMFHLAPADAGIFPIKLMDDTNRSQWAVKNQERTGSFWARGKDSKLVMLPPTQQANLSPNGEWNQAELTLDGKSATLEINGKTVQSIDLAEYARVVGDNPPLSRTRGRIGLQAHTSIVRFRNFAIKELAPAGLGLAPLQGEWVVVSEDWKGKPLPAAGVARQAKSLTFAGDRLTFTRHDNGTTYTSAGTAHANGTALDFTGTDYFGKPRVFRGLFELTGGVLRLAYPNTNSGLARPKALVSSADDDTLVIVARRRPELVALRELPSGQNKSGPWLSANGRSLYWANKRGKDHAIWRAERPGPGQPFAGATRLFGGHDITLSATMTEVILIDFDPAPTAGQNFALFSARKAAASDRSFGPRRKLTEMAGLGFVAAPCLAADGLTLYAEQFGNNKLAPNVRFRRADPADPWGKPEAVPLEGLPRGHLRFPFLSPDGRTLFGNNAASPSGLVMLTSTDGGKSFGDPRQVVIPGGGLKGKFPRYSPDTGELFFGEDTTSATAELYVIRNFHPTTGTQPLP